MTNNSKALMTTDFDILQRMALALFKSNYFQDVKSEAQAIVKVMAGSELGIPPFSAMAGIHVIQGKPALGANLIATLVKNDPRYDYRIVQCSNESCQITWTENGEAVGQSEFTFKEAQGAGLTGKDNWKKYTSDMLFARAITRGARRFAPGIFGGAPVYTPEELGADVDPDGYVEGEFTTQVRQNQIANYDTDTIDTYSGDTIDEQVADFEPEPDINEKPVYGGKSAHATELARAKAEAKKAAAEPAQNGNGKSEPLFNGNVADSRAWLEEKDKDGIVLGIVGDALGMTGLYGSKDGNGARQHLVNWLNGQEAQEIRKYLDSQGLKIDLRIKYPKAIAMRIFDRAIDRKQEAEDEQ